MKKFNIKIIGLLAVLTALLLISTVALADDTCIEIKNGEANADGTITVTVSLSGETPVAGAQFALRYDADMLELVSTKNGSTVSGGISATNDEDEGSVVFIWSTLMGSKQPGELLLLTFKAKDGAVGSVEISLDDERTQTMIIDEELNELDYSVQNAVIELSTTEASDQETQSTPNTNGSGESTAEPTATPNADISMGVGESVAITPEGGGYVFSSSNERVATVDENGNITAHENGEVTITAISEDGTVIEETTVFVGEQPAASDVAGESDLPQAAATDTTAAADDEENTGGVSIANKDEEKSRPSVLTYVLLIAAILGVAALIYAAAKAGKHGGQKF